MSIDRGYFMEDVILKNSDIKVSEFVWVVVRWEDMVGRYPRK